MTLQEEIRADLESGEMDDLFQDVKWNGKPIRALVETASVSEGMDSLGGPMLTGERQFKFERVALLQLRSTLKMMNDVITYAGRTYAQT